jgi:amidase
LRVVGGAALAIGGCAAPPAAAPPLGSISEASATGLARAIRTKQISAVEAVDRLLERIEAVNPKLNAVVQLRADAARAEARAADQALARGTVRGPLHGVPMTIKDSLDTAGLSTTGGTKGRATFVPAEDATVVKRLKAAGAILLGKTNTPELTLSFETNNLVYGRTNNPYDVTRTPGGSSGGAAAIVASGGVPFDLGSDTGGSIRVPSHFCGTAGIRPTTGRVPRTGHIVGSDGLLQSYTQIGPMARRVEDLMLLLPIIAGPDNRDPHVSPAPLGDPRAVSVSTLRVAFFTDNGLARPTDAIQAAVRQSAEAASKLGCPVTEAKLEGTAEALDAMNGLWVADGEAWIRRLLARAGTAEVGPELAGELRTAKPIAAERVTALAERQDQLRTSMLGFWDRFDLLLSPVCAAVAMPHGGTAAREAQSFFSYTQIFNFTGWPAAVVRVSSSPEGLPIGVQVVGPPWREDRVLAMAFELERALGGWKAPPGTVA